MAGDRWGGGWDRPSPHLPETGGLMSGLVILVPMLGRPHTVAPLVESIKTTTPGARVLFCVSPGDDRVHAAVDAVGCERITVSFQPVGDYARKINAGYQATTEPLIFTGACDIRFHPGWLQAATAKLRQGIGVVGTNDLGNPRVTAGQHATHFLVTRAYADHCGVIDHPGAIFHEGYPHEYVDNECVATARKRGAWAMALDSHVEHLHPSWGKAPTDAVYRCAPQRMQAGRRIYQQRSPLWAPDSPDHTTRVATRDIPDATYPQGVALVVVTDGREDYLRRTLESVRTNVAGPIAERWIFDDSGDWMYRRQLRDRYSEFTVIGSGPRLGYAGAMGRVWDIMAEQSRAGFVFHVEGDFTFNQSIDLTELRIVLGGNPKLLQLALLRQPWNQQEKRAGGVIQCNPGAYSDVTDDAGRNRLEHQLFWTCNPSLFRRDVYAVQWPQTPDSERRFTAHILQANPGGRFAFLGARNDPPRVEHIGVARTGKGY